MRSHYLITLTHTDKNHTHETLMGPIEGFKTAETALIGLWRALKDQNPSIIYKNLFMVGPKVYQIYKVR